MSSKPKKQSAAGKGTQKTFKAAVIAVPAIANSYREGVQALKDGHRKRLKNSHLATGSLDLDAALECSYPNDYRWDYGIGLSCINASEKVLWLEVHHAASGETDRVIQKLKALKRWLQGQAGDLAAMPCVFVWQLSNVEHNPNDRRKRNQLAEKHGLKRVQGVLDLSQV